MPISIKHTLSFLLIAILAGISWWLNDSTVSEKILPDESSGHEPDYYAENLQVYSLNEQGEPEYRLKATNLFHYPDNNMTELHQPEFSLYKENSTAWSIKADNGLISPEGSQARLSGNVLLARKDIDNGPNLRTDELLIYPETKTAETQSRVLIQDQHGQTEATGMKADLENNRIKLLSGVRGMYEKR